MSDTTNPLLETLPPATDYLTYLTVIEYNLTPENLPVLHEVLQDAKLTTNIGWDLVHLLLPLLPASQECLQDIARLGNPREVVLKVTECLRLIDFAGLDIESDVEEDLKPSSTDADTLRHPHTTASVPGSQITQAVEVVPRPLPVDQFLCLLSMLAILHPRIKTQYPSRFLSTTLQATLHAFTNAVSHREELLNSIVRFVKDVSGRKRPDLPSRVNSAASIAVAKTTASDPEADAPRSGPEEGEQLMQTRLIQSFVTFVFEHYMLTLQSHEDVPAMAWSVRLMERFHPRRSIPGKSTMSQRFQQDPDLKARLAAVGELVALCQDLQIDSAELLRIAQMSDDMSEHDDDGDEAEPPKSASDVPLSRIGAFLLYAARIASRALYTSHELTSDISIFPTHDKLLSSLLSPSSSSAAMIGNEPSALLDALLATVLISIEADNIGQPDAPESFNQYLRSTSLISSNCPSPSLRYVAYYITTTILRSNPSDNERLSFIKDTLEDCPMNNLKVAAVSWLKGETIEAASAAGLLPSASQPHSHIHTDDHSSDTAGSGTQQPIPTPAAAASQHSLFASPIPLQSLSPTLFPALLNTLPPSPTSWPHFDAEHPFYLSTLNFLLLVLLSPALSSTLGLDAAFLHGLEQRFLGPLSAALESFAASGTETTEAGGVDSSLRALWAAQGMQPDEEVAKVGLVRSVLDRVLDAMTASDQGGVARSSDVPIGGGAV